MIILKTYANHGNMEIAAKMLLLKVVETFSLYIYIYPASMVQKNTIIPLMEFYPGAEAKGPLGSIPMVIICYLSPSMPISRLGIHFHFSPPILHLRFCFRLCLHLCLRLCLLLQCHLILPCYRSQDLEVNTLLLQPRLCHPHSRPPLYGQTQIQYWWSRDVLGYGIL